MLSKVHRSLLIPFLGLAAIMGQATAFAETAAAPAPDYFGRWVVDDPTEKFSTNGKLYRVIDIAPCGNDFCGVSVGEQQSCGATLFRFLTSHAHDELLTGHGKWGDAKKKIQISGTVDDNKSTIFAVGLGGNEYDILAREGSMPTFEANYHRVGDAICMNDKTS